MAAPPPIRITFFGSSTSDDFAEAGSARQYLQSIYSISLESFNDPQKLWDHMSEKRKAGEPTHLLIVDLEPSSAAKGECMNSSGKLIDLPLLLCWVIGLDALPYMSLVYALICMSFTVLFVFGVISDFEATDGALVDTLTDAFYIASVMVFTVGFGDIVPCCRSIFLCDMLSMFGGGPIQFILNHFLWRIVYDHFAPRMTNQTQRYSDFRWSMMPENTMCGQIIYAATEMLSLKERSSCGRLSHALCPSPVQEAFMSLSDVFGEKLKSNDFWIECLSGSQPLKVGFKSVSQLLSPVQQL
ncbi:hypothetical protein ACLB2K_069060 [Fragaria x ananassa]